MTMKSIHFFDQQFQQQITKGEFALNPFEQTVLPHLSGGVLDLGCAVTALDASRTAVDRVSDAANRLGLSLTAYQTDLSQFEIDGDYDSIVSIGLLMFFPQNKARAMRADIQAHTKPGGIVAINVLIAGTSFMGMFEPGHYYLMGETELSDTFKGWEIFLSQHDNFPAAGNTIKKFHTLVARKPG
jgi:tellurite methyltransferase